MKVSIFVFVVIGMIVQSLPIKANTDCGSDSNRMISQYYQALQAGDVRQLSNLVAGDYARKNNALYQNPAYPDHLINHYANLSYSVSKCETVAGQRVRLVVEESLTDGESYPMVFTLEQSPDSQLQIIDVTLQLTE
ncbi:MAG: hypothetical protein AAF541_21365 [Pseudomonadota bacterium]